MNKMFLAFTMALLFVSCGQKADSSKAKFKIFSGNITSGPAQFTGGLLVLGRSIDDSQSFTVPYKDGLELELKKGSWEFATIGWFGANPMEGTQQCDHQVVELSSDTFSVNFAMTPGKCLDSSTVDGKRFTDPRYYSAGFGFKKVQVDTCANFSSCSGSIQTAPAYFRIEIPSSLDGIPAPAGVPASLISQCVAGAASNITPPHGGDNGFIGMKVSVYPAAVVAKYSQPGGVVVDSNGNIFVADSANHSIRKIDINGVSSTFAGLGGTSGSADGAGADARFNNPTGLAIDPSNNIYVADTNNNKIRKITAGGVVTTLAGTGGSGNLDAAAASAVFYNPTGVAVDPSSPNDIYVSDTGNNSIRSIISGTVATVATGFSAPAGIVIYGGYIFLANSGYHDIIKYPVGGGGVVYLAGSHGVSGSVDATGTSASFYSPTGLAVNPANGDLFVTDLNNYKIRKVTQAGVVTTLAGTGSFGSTDGIGAAASFNLPAAVAFSSSGNLFVADTSNKVIRKLALANNQVSLLSGVVNFPGTTDGPASSIPCTGVAKNYYFEHGLGKELNATYFDAGASVNRRGILSIQTATSGGAILSDPTLQGTFLGDWTSSSTLPACGSPQLGNGYFYRNATMGSSPLYPNDGDYIYCNGSTFQKFTPGQTVKLILQD